jgi:AAA domain
MIPAELRSTKERLDVGLKFIVYGRSGAGKTRLAATSPSALVLDCERGTSSLARPEIAPIARWEIRGGFAGLAKPYHWLTQDPDARENFKTVFLDSLSDLAEQEFEILSNEGKTDSKSQFKDPRAVYGEVARRAVSLLRYLRDLPFFNVVILAKQGEVQDEVNKRILYGIELPGRKLATQVPYLFDGVYRLWVDANNRRWLQTGADIQYDAKDRIGLDFQEDVTTDFGRIFTKLETALASNTKAE